MTKNDKTNPTPSLPARLKELGFTGDMGRRLVLLDTEWGGRAVRVCTTRIAFTRSRYGMTTGTIGITAQVPTRWRVYADLSPFPTPPIPSNAVKLTPVPAPIDTHELQTEDVEHLQRLLQNPVALEALATLLEPVHDTAPSVEVVPGHLLLIFPVFVTHDLTTDRLPRWRDALVTLAAAAEASPVASPRQPTPREASWLSQVLATHPVFKWITPIAIAVAFVSLLIGSMISLIFILTIVFFFFLQSIGIF